MRRAFVFALVLAAPTSASAQDASVAEIAQNAEMEGDLARARTLYETVAQSDDARTSAEGLYRLGALSDGAFEFADARKLYAASVARDPSSRYAGRALARIDELDAHAEGGFAPLVALEGLRRDAARSNDARAIEGIEREAEGFPPGAVRAETWLLVGDAYIGRLERPRDAARVFRRLAADRAASENLRALAATRLVEARSMLGEESEAVREVIAVRATPEVQSEARVLARRKSLRNGALGVLSAVSLIGVYVLLAARRRALGRAVLAVWRRPLPVVHIAVLSLGGALLAWRSDGHGGGPFYALGAGTLALHLLGSAWNVVGPQSAPHRALRAAVAAVAVLAVSFLAMHALDTMMLEGIKL